MKIYKIACIPGDGIGKEVVPAGQKVLTALAAASDSFRFDFETFGWGGDWYRAHGEMMPHSGLDALRHARHPRREVAAHHSVQRVLNISAVLFRPENL